MQKPFQLTPEMAKEIDDEISSLAPAPNQNKDDPTRYISRPKRLFPGLAINVLPDEGVQEGPSNDKELPEGSTPKDVETLTTDRGKTHGHFRDNARLSQMLKETFRSTSAWHHLDDVEKESLDMIALKISRILSGKSLEKQHWEDVEGYAHLALKECGV